MSDLRRLGYDGSSRRIVDEGKRVVWCAVLLRGWLATEFLVQSLDVRKFDPFGFVWDSFEVERVSGENE